MVANDGPLELAREPRTVEELRDLQTQMPPLPNAPRPGRGEDRRTINLPIQIVWETSDGREHLAAAHATEITSTSVYFELDPAAGLCSPELLLELEAGRELSLCAVARVARVETKGSKIGIAVEIEGCRFRAIRQAARAQQAGA